MGVDNKFLFILKKIGGTVGVPNEKKVVLALSVWTGGIRLGANKKEAILNFLKEQSLYRYWDVEEERDLFHKIKFGKYRNGSIVK